MNRQELAGAVADLGVLVPIAVALMVKNGLEATAVLLPAGLLYVLTSLVYRLPISVQPLKAFGAIAIAQGFGSNEIAAGALLMGAIFLLLGATGAIDLARRAFPRPLIRGVQLGVGLLLIKIALGLVADAPASFTNTVGPELAVPVAAALLVGLLVFRNRSAALVLVSAGTVTALIVAGDQIAAGPSGISTPSIDGAVLWSALTLLVIPQIPLTFANSCLASADAARSYFGNDRARRVSPGRLAMTLGSANLLAGSISGMPVCHGAGGITAHYKFGARTWRAPLAIGVTLIGFALVLGSGLAGVLAAFPLPVLAALLGAAGVLHIGLLADLRGNREWIAALAVGTLGFTSNLVFGLVLGLAVWWLPELVRRLHHGAVGDTSIHGDSTG